MRKHIKAKAKKASTPAKKKPERFPEHKPYSGTTNPEHKKAMGEPAPKKPEYKKKVEPFHEVTAPKSEFTQQLGSNYQPPENEKNGQ